MGSHSATIGRASVPASVLLDRLALAVAEGAAAIPSQRSRHRAPDDGSAAETTRRMRPVQVYGAAAIAVSVIGGAAAGTASFGSGVVSDLSDLATDLSFSSHSAAPNVTQNPAQKAAEPITQILPAAVAAAAPAGADLPQAKASAIAASVLDSAGKLQATVQGTVPAIAALPVKAAPAQAAAPAPAQAISLGSPMAAKAMSTAMGKIGKPYVWGAAGPNAFDCSGLVQWAYKQWGVMLPHSSAAQSKIGTPVAKSDLRPGDLVFFYSPVSHVGIYVGNGKVLNASEPGQPVKLSTLANMPFHNARRI